MIINLLLSPVGATVVDVVSLEDSVSSFIFSREDSQFILENRQDISYEWNRWYVLIYINSRYAKLFRSVSISRNQSQLTKLVHISAIIFDQPKRRRNTSITACTFFMF